MAHKCVVGACPNSSDTVIHYILPEEPRRRSVWLQFIERSKPAGELIPQSSRVCGDHFSLDSFTQLQLGFTTRLILNIDAVPTIYCSNRAPKEGTDVQAPTPRKEVNETCNVTISSTVSLACVKEEPFEHDVSHVMKPVEETKSPSSTRCIVKKEENETCLEGSKQLQVNQRADVKCVSSRSALVKRSKDNKWNKFDLMEHESNHLEKQTDKMYHCNQCGENFEQQAFLKAHEKIHKDTKGSVKKHTPQTVHAGCKPVCPFCDKTFGRMVDFFKHIDSHVVVTPFYCSICKLYQLTKQGLIGHMRIHKKTKKRIGKGTQFTHIKRKRKL